MRQRASSVRHLSTSLTALAALLGGASCVAPQTAVRPALGTSGDARIIDAAVSRQGEEAPKYFAARGFFVGAMGVATTLSDSDFDGQSGLMDPQSGLTIVLPELDPGIGWGVTVGYRGKRNSVQFSYAVSEHDDEFLGGSFEDEFKNYSLDFKHYWNVDGALQPFVLLGVSVPRLIVENGGALGASTGDAAVQGLGANLGGGAALYLTPHLALFGEAYYRWAEFDRASSLGVHRDIKGHLDASGFGLRGGISYTF